MKELILLGTGNAMVTKCFNTCFAIHLDDEYFLVDAGGGNGILSQLEKANVDMRRRIRQVYKNQRTGMFQLILTAKDLNSLCRTCKKFGKAR